MPSWFFRLEKVYQALIAVMHSVISRVLNTDFRQFTCTCIFTFDRTRAMSSQSGS